MCGYLYFLLARGELLDPTKPCNQQLKEIEIIGMGASQQKVHADVFCRLINCFLKKFYHVGIAKNVIFC